MSAELKYCNDTYVRGGDGVWRYAWGDPVPGAVDLTLADLLAIDDGVDTAAVGAALRPVSKPELEWLTGRSECLDEVLVRPNGGRTPNAGDLIIGMSAPELHVRTMLTVAEIADLADVSKATIDSYRYRGYLPAPQSVRGRTPLWARPVIRRWLKTRPGCGWRTDIYGDAATARQSRQRPSARRQPNPTNGHPR
ncbi:helix-turn-helix domain-containing protein [Nitriliruptoraceae bacterium ZYF776]|nr:helix-turn-helix domain-containing protein [Profundirhabdus halotolerans]